MNTNTSLPITKTERNYGLDLLRPVAMFMVVLLHVLGRGGILSAYGRDGSFLKYELVWLLEIAAYGAVDCYALLSGYVGVNVRHKPSGLIMLTLQTVFYTVSITLGFLLFMPGSTSIGDLLKAFLPFGFHHYWYYTAYFCLFFFLPFLNKLLHSLSHKQLVALIGTIVLMFSLLPTLFLRDIFTAVGGYTPLWLALLYLLGGALRLLDVGKNTSPRRCFELWAFAIGLTWCSHILIGTITPHLFGETKGQMLLINYVSPTILFGACALVVGFARLQPGPRAKKVVGWLSPLAFGVYLIHTEPLIWTHFMANRYLPLAHVPALLLIPTVLLAAFGLWLVCTLIEFLRHRLFLWLRVKRFADWLDGKLTVLFSRLLKRFLPFAGEEETDTTSADSDTVS